MNKNVEHILTPATTLLDEATYIISGMNWDVKSFAFAEYILHSLFLKITGMQEQKFKCLVWEIGSEDIEFRTKQIYDKKWEYGECSTLSAKVEIIKALYRNIQQMRFDPSVKIISDKERDDIYDKARDYITDLYQNVLKESVYQREYNNFIEIWGKIMPKDSFLAEENGQLVPTKNEANYKENDKVITFTDVYERLYYFRNLCAHNFRVFQTNGYEFDRMRKVGNVTNNYFFRFAILIVIDEFIMLLYNRFLELINSEI